MCGRFVIKSPPDILRRMLDYREHPNFPPRYNIAPTQPVPIVRLEQGGRTLQLVRWGLLPAWVKDPKAFSLVINARAESVNEKPAFRLAMQRRRCLIPADGFYEWKGEGAAKRAYYAHAADGQPFAFAGLWECWTGPNGEEMESAAIVTTTANRVLGAIHHRMPVILPAEAYAPWLDCAGVDGQEATTLLRPAPDEMMIAHPVSAAVNKVVNDDARLIEAVSEENALPSQPDPRRRKSATDERQASLF
ncbi:MAG: SOS response-associated peptidase [Pseudorhodoplanes sp.]